VSAFVLVLSAACTSSTPDADPTLPPVTSDTPTPTQEPTTPAPTVPASPTVSAHPVVPTGSESPAPLGQPTCDPKNVTITDADTVRPRGASYRAEVYVLRTTGKPCQLVGYPSVLVNGTTVTRGGQGLPPETPQPFTLSTATSLSFALATSRSGTDCTDQTAITVTLPGTSTPRGVVTTLRVCDHQLGVSPIHRLGDDE
jgi:hypothetical protein